MQRVLELFKQTGVASEGEAFLRTTADEISKRARRRVQLVKERQDLQKIMEFVQTHKQVRVFVQQQAAGSMQQAGRQQQQYPPTHPPPFHPPSLKTNRS